MGCWEVDVKCPYLETDRGAQGQACAFRIRFRNLFVRTHLELVTLFSGWKGAVTELGASKLAF